MYFLTGSSFYLQFGDYTKIMCYILTVILFGEKKRRKNTYLLTLVKPAHAFTSIKQSPVLKDHLFLSC
jgi:hypothetical protein